MPLTAIPTFPAIGSATFNADAYAWAVFLAGTHSTELNALETAVDADSSSSSVSAALAGVNATTAANYATSASVAASIAGATAFVSGDTYAIGDPRYSLVDFQNYRCKTAGIRATDPSADLSNWARVATSVGSVVVQTTTGTWTCPAGVTRAKFTVTGGGASSPTNASFSPPGGGAGGTAIAWRAVVPGTVYTLTIGAGGTANTGAGVGGNAGGSSTVTGSGFTTMTGNGAGVILTSEHFTTGGSASGGDINLTGGGTATVNNGGSTIVNLGGSSYWGHGRAGQTSPNYGVGGGASGLGSTVGVAGSPGVVVIEY